MGPCSPCVCTQICNTDNDECLYVHQHKMNDPQELQKKIQLHFTLADNNAKPNVEVSLFTRTNKNEFSDQRFKEGSHKARVIELADTIAEAASVKKETVYYNQTSTKVDVATDRFVICKGKKLYRLDRQKQKRPSGLKTDQD